MGRSTTVLPQGFPVAEIAARAYLRETFGISRKEVTSTAHVYKPETKKQPFPLRRPEVVIAEGYAEPISVYCPELRWWTIVPESVEHSLFATYTPTTWELSEVHETHAARPVIVHDVDGTEMWRFTHGNHKAAGRHRLKPAHLLVPCLGISNQSRCGELI